MRRLRLRSLPAAFFTAGFSPISRAATIATFPFHGPLLQEISHMFFYRQLRGNP
jgi:hypothetical protein